MHKIVFLDRSTLEAEVRRPSFEHDWTEYPTCTADQVASRIDGANIVITNKAPITAEVLNDGVALVAVAATGVNNIDVEACAQRGVSVCNVRDYAENTVPEHVFCLALALQRNLLKYNADVKAGKWAKAPGFCLLDHPVRDLFGSTLGIIGYGAIGRGVQRIAEGFGMTCLISERKGATEVRAGRVALDALLAKADVVTVHCPLNDETRGLIGPAELELMKSSAILINTARGGVVDEAALKEALLARQIAGAATDVLSTEPPKDGNVLLDDIPGLIVTPHMAWASGQAMQRLADQLIDNVEAFVAGRPQNVLTSPK